MLMPRWLTASAVAVTLSLALPAVPMHAYGQQTSTEQSTADANAKKAKKHAKKAAAKSKDAAKTAGSAASEAGKATAEGTKSVAKTTASDTKSASKAVAKDTKSTAKGTANDASNVGNALKDEVTGDHKNATAKCKDGTFTYAKGHSGACSGHGGVAVWMDKSAPKK